MSGLQRIVMAIPTAVFLRSILKQILQDQKMKDWMHLLGGIYITVVIACGIRQLDYSAVTDQIHSSWEEADFYSMEGKHQADAVLHQRIKTSRPTLSENSGRDVLLSSIIPRRNAGQAAAY